MVLKDGPKQGIQQVFDDYDANDVNLLKCVQGLIVQFGICTDPMLIGPGSEQPWDVRRFDNGIKPIGQKFADAAIPVVPVETC